MYYLEALGEKGIKCAGFIYMYLHHQEAYSNKVINIQIILIRCEANVMVNPVDTAIYDMLVNTADDISRDDISSYLKNAGRQS